MLYYTNDKQHVCTDPATSTQTVQVGPSKAIVGELVPIESASEQRTEECSIQYTRTHSHLGKVKAHDLDHIDHLHAVGPVICRSEMLSSICT